MIKLRCNRLYSGPNRNTCGRPAVAAFRGTDGWMRLRCEEHAALLVTLPGVADMIIRGEERILAEVVSDALREIA